MNITIEELRELLKRTSEVLESLGIAHHFTGGIAASIHGEPRFTQDIDVVVEIPKLDTKAKTLYEALIQHFDVNEPSLRDAIYRQSIFQALDRELLIKVDFHIGEAIPGELGRSRVIEVAPGLQVRVVSKEDAILSKLLWIKKGSHKSRNDVTMMLRAPPTVDVAYIEKQADVLNVVDLWQEIKQTGIK